ncbi:MAG: hypothetical protein ACI9NT_002608 [Bacteroidia bacterium]|jgi:hypothetical protein
MSLRGHCPCRNFELVWQTVDLSLVPRACQCEYCRGKGAAYVSKSGSAFTVQIHQPEMHNVVRHGSGTAMFHECGGCGAVVFVTAEIEGLTYGALNAACINNTRGFGSPVTVDFSAQDAADKVSRWQQNWCCPVTLTV